MVNPYQSPGSQLVATAVDGSLSDGHHEFDARENAIIGRTARLSRIWGIIALISGVLLVLTLLGSVGFTLAFAGEINNTQVLVVIIVALVAALLPAALVNLATGWYYVDAGRTFQDVVDTSGADIPLLMTGLARTVKAFQVELVFIAVAVVLGLATQLLSVFLNAANQGG